MSLINQVLNDLGKRQQQQEQPTPATEDALVLQRAGLATARKSFRQWYALVALIAILAIFTGVYFLYVVPGNARLQGISELVKANTAPNNVGQGASNQAGQGQGDSEAKPQLSDRDKIIVLPKPDQGAVKKTQTLTAKVLPVVTGQAAAASGELTGQTAGENVSQTAGENASEKAGVAANIANRLTASQAIIAASVKAENGQVVQPALAKVAKTSLRGGNPDSGEVKSAAAPNQIQLETVNVTVSERVEKIYQQAQKLSVTGMIKQAIEKYQQVLALDSRHSPARVALVGLYYGQEKVDLALMTLDQGLAIQSNNIEWLLLAAKIHYKQQNYRAALNYLQQPVETQEKEEYIALKAVSLQQLGRLNEAVSEYQRLTAVNPNNGRWWLGLATTLEGDGQITAAITAYQQCLGLSNISLNSRQYVRSRLQALLPLQSRQSTVVQQQ